MAQMDLTFPVILNVCHIVNLKTNTLTDDVADVSNFVTGAIEGGEFLCCCSANRVLTGTKRTTPLTLLQQGA